MISSYKFQKLCILTVLASICVTVRSARAQASEDAFQTPGILQITEELTISHCIIDNATFEYLDVNDYGRPRDTEFTDVEIACWRALLVGKRMFVDGENTALWGISCQKDEYEWIARAADRYGYTELEKLQALLRLESLKAEEQFAQNSPASDVDFHGQNLPKGARVLGPCTPMTCDYVVERMQIRLNEKGIVEEVLKG